jgi:hypothetical protein
VIERFQPEASTKQLVVHSKSKNFIPTQVRTEDFRITQMSHTFAFGHMYKNDTLTTASLFPLLAADQDCQKSREFLLDIPGMISCSKSVAHFHRKLSKL